MSYTGYKYTKNIFFEVVNKDYQSAFYKKTLSVFLLQNCIFNSMCCLCCFYVIICEILQNLSENCFKVNPTPIFLMYEDADEMS